MPEAKRVDAPAGELSEHALCRAVGGANPFVSNRVSDPGESLADAPDVHGMEFQKLLRRISDVRGADRSIGLTLLGAAGVGKSHLLARLFRWAKEKRSVEYVFLHNLQASPERMARYVLKGTVNHLFAYRYGTANLYSLLLGALPPTSTGKTTVQLIAELQAQSQQDREIYAVLVGFMEALKLADHDPSARLVADSAVDWLCGEQIDEESAERLSRLSGRKIGTMLSDNLAVERTFVVLSKLLSLHGKTLVLCLDQIDNLDDDQVASLTAFLHALIDHSSNLLVITSGVTSSMLGLKDRGAIAEAAWDRLAEYRVELFEVTADAARQIVMGRLGQFLEPFERLEGLVQRRAADELFPLGERFWTRRVGDALQVRPRDVITWARDAWEAEQDAIGERGYEGWLDDWSGREADGSTAVGETSAGSTQVTGELAGERLDEQVGRKLEELVAARTLEPRALPPDADNLATLTRALLETCEGHEGYSLLGVERQRPTRSKKPAFDLVATERDRTGREVRTGVFFVTSRNATSVAGSLRRVAELPDPPEHVLLVSDERCPLRLGGKGKQYHAELAQRGSERFDHVKLTLEQYAELDALLSLLRQARVADFEVRDDAGNARPVTEAELADSYHRLDRYRGHVLLHELVTEDLMTVRPAPPAAPLGAAVVRDAIVGMLSWKTGAGAREVATKVSEDSGLSLSDALLRQVVDVADELHRQGVIQCVPQENDRYLWWLGGSP